MSYFSRVLWVAVGGLMFALLLDKLGLPVASPTASLDDALATPLRGMVEYFALSFGVGGLVTLAVKALRDRFNLP